MSSISAVSYTQRKDLLDYLTKQSSTSRNLKSLESGPVDVNAALGKSESQGNRLEEAIRHVSDDKMALVKGDLPVVKSVLARERVLSTRKSILAIKGSKVFGNGTNSCRAYRIFSKLLVWGKPFSLMA